MRLNWSGNAHLTFCLNVFPAGTLAELDAALFVQAPAVFQRVAQLTGHGGPWGIGLWLPAQLAETLDQSAVSRLTEQLASHRLYVFTVNAFPYGMFHGQRVKDNVYLPDWSDPRRLTYTLRAAQILAQVLPPGTPGSISSVPVAYRPRSTAERLTAAGQHLGKAALELSRLQEKTGKMIRLALEPEPGCVIEDSASAVDVFEHWLIPAAVCQLHEKHGLAKHTAEELFRDHIGICLDTVHCAVMFEAAADSLRRLTSAGLRVWKIQLGAALATESRGEAPPALAQFCDPIYLHQTRIQTLKGIFDFADLPLALAAPQAGEWRVHYHVPRTWRGQSGLRTADAAANEDFFKLAESCGVAHYEVELYTLPLLTGSGENVNEVIARDVALVVRQ